MNMNFGADKTPIEVLKAGAFGKTSFRDIYYGVNSKWHRKSWKEFDDLGDIYYCTNYYVSVNKYGVKCGTSSRFWENKGWINPIDPYCWFQWNFRYWLGTRSSDDVRQINRWIATLSRFKGKLIKMIKNVNGRFDDSFISLKIRKIGLHWSYELVESDLF